MRFWIAISISLFASLARAQMPSGADLHNLTVEERAFLVDLIQASAKEPYVEADIRKVLLAHPQAAREAALQTSASIGQAAGANGQSAMQLGMLALVKANPKLNAVTDYNDGIAVVNALEPATIQQLRDDANQQVANFKFSEIPAIKAMVDPVTGVHTSNETLNEFIQKLLPLYYDKYPAANKREIITGLLKLQPNAPTEQQFSVIELATLPTGKKMFQLAGVQKVLADNAPMPESELMAITTSALGKDPNQVFKSFYIKPKQVGSIGQVNQGEYNGELVMVKTMRANVVPDIDEERTIFRQLIGSDPKLTHLSDTAEKLIDSVESEGNLKNEGQNLDRSVAHDDPSLGIRTVRRIADLSNTPNFLVMEAAPGSQASKITEPLMLPKKLQAQKNLLKWFFANSIYGDGFFHGDLHPGNYFIEFTMPRGKNPPFTVHVIDLGHVAVMTPKEQAGFLRILVAGGNSHVKDSVKAIALLAPLTPKQEGVLASKFRQIFAENLPVGQRIADMIKETLEAGVKLPESLISHNRTRMLLEDAIHETEAAINQSHPVKPVANTEIAAYTEVFRQQTMKQNPFKTIFTNWKVTEGMADLWAHPERLTGSPHTAVPATGCGPALQAIVTPKP